jgi:hypothetical protein
MMKSELIDSLESPERTEWALLDFINGRPQPLHNFKIVAGFGFMKEDNSDIGVALTLKGLWFLFLVKKWRAENNIAEYEI